MSFKLLRRSTNVSQVKLSKILGITQTTVSKWETGKAVPRFETMQKIAIALSCQLSEVTECFVKKQ